MKLRSTIAALHAALLAILLAASPAGSGSMTLLGVGKASGSSGGVGTVYTLDVNSFTNAGTNSSFTISYPAMAVNALVIVSVESSGGPTTSVVDGVGAFTRVGTGDAQNGIPNQTVDIFWAFRAAASGSFTVTTTTSAGCNIWLTSFTGTTTPAIDSGGTYTGHTSPAWTTTATNTLLFGMVGTNNGSMTVLSPWTTNSPSSQFGAPVWSIANSVQTGATINDNGGTSGGYYNGITTAFK